LNVFSYGRCTFAETGEIRIIGTAFNKYSQLFQTQIFYVQKNTTDKNAVNSLYFYIFWPI